MVIFEIQNLKYSA